MTEQNSSYFAEIGGDFKGIQGDISGGVINQYIITEKSGIEIKNQRLIPGSPYLGLRKFEVDDKDKFFGRDRWIIELTNYLEKKNILLLLGASGSGKSSLVQAGLIPALKDRLGSNQLVNLTFVPDVNPFKSFCYCLAPKYGQSQAELALNVKEDTLIEVVQTLKNDTQWLIFIDQFEELFTRTPKTEQSIFIKSLIKLINNSDNSVKVIMTMRADFLDKLSPYPDLGKVHDSSSRMLTDMEDSDLRLAIAEPAASVEERDRLQKAEIERQKRARKTAQRIAAGSVVAVVISGSLGAVAFIQYQIANQQTQVAVRQSRIALARQLATQAELNRDKANFQEFSTLDESSQNFTLKLGLDSFPPNIVSLLEGINPRILRFSRDNKLLAVTDDKFLYFFNIDSGKETKISEQTIIYAMNFSPDGKTLATAGQDATLKLWNVEKGREIQTLQGHNDSLTTTAFSPDGKLLVTASFDKTIKLWNAETGKLIRTLKGHTDIINSAVFSPDGKYLLTAGEDKTAKIWDSKGREISTLRHDRPVRLAVFTAGGNIATVSGDTVVRIFSLSKLRSPE